MQKTLTFFFSSLLLLSTAFSQVVINEIMYNPYYETSPGDPNTYDTNDDGEWFELFNAGQSAVDMSNWTVSDGVEFTFPSGTSLEAGKYLVVARSAERFKADNGSDPDLIWTSGALSNSGENLEVKDANGNVVDAVDYDDEGDWGAKSSGSPPTAAAASADGLGPSLELKDFAKDNASAETSSGNWGESSGKGSPNAINTNFNGTVWKSTLATDDKPIRTIPAGTWTQDAKPVINSLAEFPKDTTYWQYWANTGGDNATNETEGGHFEHQGSSGKDSSYANVSYSNGYMKVDYSTHDTEGWGGYVKLQHMHPDTLNGMYDWSQYDSLSYQYYVDSAGVATQSSSITVRFNLIEYSTIDGAHDYTGSQALGELSLIHI